MSEIETEITQKISLAGKKQTTFAGDVLKLTTGTIIAQLLVVITSPFLTRLYKPDAFGMLALFTSIAGIIGVIACLRYELAIMLPARDKEAVNLLGLSIAISAIVSLVTIPIIWFGGGHIARWLNLSNLAPFLWYLPPLVFIHGTFMALNYWNTRTKHFARLSIARVATSVTTTSITLGVGYAGYPTGGTMIGASVLGQTVATIMLGSRIWQNSRSLFRKYIRLSSMRAGFNQYKKFPVYDIWSALLNTVSVQLPTLLLSIFFSSTSVGLYALSFRLIAIPMNFVGNAISQVFYQRGTEAKHIGDLAEVVSKTFLRLVSFGAFPFLVIMVIGKDIFALVFGTQWSEAGAYAQILAPWMLFVFLGSPMSTLFLILEIQDRGLMFNMMFLITRAAALTIGGATNSILVALLLYSSTGTIIWVVLCIYFFRKVGLSIRLLTERARLISIILFVAIAPISIAKIFSMHIILLVVIACLCTFGYYLLFFFYNQDLQIFIKTSLLKHLHLA